MNLPGYDTWKTMAPGDENPYNQDPPETDPEWDCTLCGAQGVASDLEHPEVCPECGTVGTIIWTMSV